MTTLTKQDMEVLRSIVQDKDELKFIRTFMRIPSKARQVVPFDPWPVQERLARSLGLRNMTVKDTQCGSTSIYTAIFLKRTITQPNTTTIIMAHKEQITQRLLHRAQILYDSLPSELKPALDHKSAYEKRFPEINSVMYIATAGSAIEGRGEPIHNLLLSEAAFYPAGTRERIIIPMIERVPAEGCVVAESTPNGEDEYMYPEVQKILAGESIYKLNVVHWWDNPDNFLPRDSELALERDRGVLTFEEEERVLVSLYNLTENQIRWRRAKIAATGELFFQEHFESLATFFLITGSPYYSPEAMTRLAESCYPAPHSGPGGSQVWFEPEERGMYVMGVDPGQGKMTETAASVWRIFAPPSSPNEPAKGPQMVAKLSDLRDAVEMKDDIWALAKYYNWALVNPEANGHGQGFIREFKNYPHLWWREDIVSGQKSMQIGWLTTGRTKPFMMQTMKHLMPVMECHDAELVKQFRGFRDLGLGKTLPTTMDDQHDAAGLALVTAAGVPVNKQRGYRGSSGFTSWDK